MWHEAVVRELLGIGVVVLDQWGMLMQGNSYLAVARKWRESTKFSFLAV